MPSFFVSIAFSFIAWSVVAARYIWPGLRLQPRAAALQPLLILHSFRFMGLAFLVPGVVSLLALAALPSGGAGIVVAWIFNLWGSADLLNAFYQANSAGLQAGQLGATYFIPTVLVPLLLITHGLVFRILLRPQNVSAVQESRRPVSRSAA